MAMNVNDGNANSDENENRLVCRAAVRFSRMWGVMETLGKLPPIGPDRDSSREYEDRIIEWAREYTASGQWNTDEDDTALTFFEAKIQNL